MTAERLDPYDPMNLQIDEPLSISYERTDNGRTTKRLKKHSEPEWRQKLRRAPFIMGPLPKGWLQKAATVTERPHKALNISMALWELAGYSCVVTEGGNPIVRLPSRLAEEWGVSRDGQRDVLATLEKAGLVRVDRASGRPPDVTLLLSNTTTTERK